jgi:hypothetical protein
MPELGFALSSEDHGPAALVEQAALAEQAGFTFALISDHYHPWIRKQGHAPFVWATLGGIAHATSTLRIGTGVTCPLIRQHPALVAQAAATVACMTEGRFFLGVGTGEQLNEHVFGARWPAPDEDVVKKFGQDKPKLGMMHVAYDTDAKKALKRAHELWPNTALQGSLGQELPTPQDFEDAAPMVSPDDVGKITPHGPDPEPYLEQIRKFEQAGFTHVYIHQIGDNQKEFCEWASRELLQST